MKGNDYFDALIKKNGFGQRERCIYGQSRCAAGARAKEQVADLSQLSNISSYTEQMRSQMEEKSGKNLLGAHNCVCFWPVLQYGFVEEVRTKGSSKT